MSDAVSFEELPSEELPSEELPSEELSSEELPSEELPSEVEARIDLFQPDKFAVDAAAEIYELLPRQLGTTVTEVAFLTGKGVQVTTGSGEVALLGDSGGITYKLAVWAAVASEARREGIAYSVVDLRYGNRPVLQ